MTRQVVAVSLLTLIAQLAAMGKIWLVARYFGVGADLDGYYLALVLPSLLTGVLGGAIQSGLFPVYAHLRARKGAAAVERLERALLIGIAGFTLGLTVLLIVVSSPVATLLARGAPTAVVNATAFALPFAAVTIALSGTEQLVASYLALRRRYTLAAAAPIANAFVGGTLLVVWPEGGLLNLILGTVLGAAAQLAIVLRSAQKSGFRLRGDLPVKNEIRAEVVEMAKLGGWVLPGLVVTNATITIPPLLMAGFGEGAVSAFSYAFRLHLSVVQFLAMAASPLILARFSELVANGEYESSRRLLRRGFALSLMLGAGYFAAVVFVGEPLLVAVFGYGLFDSQAAARVANHWQWMSAGLFPAIWGVVLTKYLMAVRAPLSVTFGWCMGMVGLLAGAHLSRSVFAEYSTSVGVAASTYLSCLTYWAGYVYLHQHDRPRRVPGLSAGKGFAEAQRANDLHE